MTATVRLSLCVSMPANTVSTYPLRLDNFRGPGTCAGICGECRSTPLLSVTYPSTTTAGRQPLRRASAVAGQPDDEPPSGGADAGNAQGESQSAADGRGVGASEDQFGVQGAENRADGMDVLFERVAGLDVGKASVTVC